MAVIRKATLDNRNKVALFFLCPWNSWNFHTSLSFRIGKPKSHLRPLRYYANIFPFQNYFFLRFFFVPMQMDQEGNNKSSGNEVTSFGYFLPLLFFPILTLFNYTPVCLRWFARKLICLKETKIGEKLSVIF